MKLKAILAICGFYALSYGYAESANRSKVQEKVEIAIKEAYLREAVKRDNPWREKRLALIKKAKDDCGGRYEGRKFVVLPYELDDFHDKIFSEPNAQGEREFLGIEYGIREKYALVEQAMCSFHGGGNLSTINAVKLSANYSYKINTSDFEAEDPIVRDLKIEARYVQQIPSREYKAPYDAQSDD